MPQTNGARHFAEAMQGYGVTHLFFVPAILLEAMAHMEDMGIRRVMVHGEKAAAYMADGYARASGRPGVCAAQHIGASNLAAGLRDAMLAGAPVIALTGGPAPGARYRHAYQELEDFPQFDATTKFNARVDDVARLPDLLRQAFREATTGAPGPVHLQLRGHHGQVTEAAGDLELRVEEAFRRVPPHRPPADAQAVEAALGRLRAARRPIIVAGGGVVWSEAQTELVELAERWNVPVATSLNGKGVIADTHRLSVGVVGAYSRACANRAVHEADLVFFVGSHTGGQVTANWKIPAPSRAVIHLDIDAREPGRNYPDTVAVIGDARTVLRQMLAAEPAPPGTDDAWVARCASLAAEWRTAQAPHLASEASPMRPERICAEISRALPADGLVVCDTGHAGIWASTMIDFTRPGQRLIRSAGSMGWGFPASLGVKCARPDAPVLCFTGDGAFYYHIAELETAARHGIHVVVVVNNNASLNQEIPLFDKAYGGTQRGRAEEMWRFGDVDFVQVARGMGCEGARAANPAEFAAALEQGFAAKGPFVIDAASDWQALAAKAWTA